MDKYKSFFFEEQNEITLLKEKFISINLSRNEVDYFISCGVKVKNALDIKQRAQWCIDPFFVQGGNGFDFCDFYNYRIFAKNLNVDPDFFLTEEEFIENNNKIIRNIEKMKNENQNKKRVKEKGYIYLIKSQRYYKIGISKNVKKRVEKFITENPNEIKIIHTYESNDYKNEEKRLHKKFEHKRHRGEWFKLNKEDIDYICTL